MVIFFIVASIFSLAIIAGLFILIAQHYYIMGYRDGMDNEGMKF